MAEPSLLRFIVLTLVRCAAFASLLCSAFAAQGQLAPAEQAKFPAYVKFWTHLGLAQVGRAVDTPNANATLLRRISLGVVVPAIPGSGRQLECVRSAFNGDGTASRAAIGDIVRNLLSAAYVAEAPFNPEQPAFDDDAAYAEAYMKVRLQEQQQANADTINNANNALREGLQLLQSRLATPKCNAFIETTILVLVQRVCSASDTRCGLRDAPATPPLPGNPWADRFDTLVQWGNTYRPPAAQPTATFQRDGLLLPNTPVAIGYESLAEPAKVILQNFLGGTSLLTPSDVDPHEPEIKDLKQLQRTVEALVQSIRGRKQIDRPQLGSGVFLVTNTPLEIAARLSDPRMVRQPALSLAFLRSEPKSTLLHIKTDELAVTRIRNCTQLQAVQVADVAGLTKCSGYELTNRDQVVACISGKSCVPAFAGVAAIDQGMRVVGSLPRAAAQFGIATRDVRQLALAATLPRLSDAKETFDAISRRVNEKCKGAPSVDSANSGALAECLMRNGFEDKRAGETYGCIQAATKSGSASLSQIAKCADSNLDTRMLDCPKISGAGLARCVLDAQVPAGEKALLECVTFEKDPYARASCVVAKKTGVNVAALKDCDAKRALDCLSKLAPELKPVAIGQACASTGTAKGSIDCAETLGIKLPKDLKPAVLCASQGSWEAATGCIASQQLGGEAGVLAGCFVQSNGDGYGAAGCYAGRLLKLNQDLQMVVACAVSTGGVAPATAVCVFGRFAFRELGNCMGKKFGEDKCFGKNNTLVKTFGIGPNSVVADIVNVHLSVLTATVAFIRNPGAAFDSAAQNFGRELSIALNNVKRELGKVLEDARIVAKDLIAGRGVYVKLSDKGLTVGPVKIRWG